MCICLAVMRHEYWESHTHRTNQRTSEHSNLKMNQTNNVTNRIQNTERITVFIFSMEQCNAIERDCGWHCICRHCQLYCTVTFTSAGGGAAVVAAATATAATVAVSK